MNSIPSLSPKHAEPSRANSGITPTIETIKQDISDCLGEESRKTLQEKTETFAKLLGQLQDEIERKSEEINYDYDFLDYKKRIGQSDEVLQRVFEERVLGDENIRSLYEALLESVDVDTREVLKYKLWEEYFEDLVYESMEKRDYEMDERSINLTRKIFAKYSNDELNKYLENMGNVTNIDLIEAHLDKLNEQQLQIIFKNLRNIKSINLHHTNLNKLDEKQLQVIFENLRNIKSINLHHTNLNKGDERQLQIIFENLRNVESIDLSFTIFSQLDENKLHIIFENLRNLKSVNLSWNNLLYLDEKRGQIIFENLRNVKSVNLSWNNLEELDEKRLCIIFDNLVNAEKIFLSESPEFVKNLILLFPHLKDKIIY